MRSKRALSLFFAMGCLLSACGGSSSSNVPTTPATQKQIPVTIDNMTTVPVINGSTTQGRIYIYNSSNTNMTGLSYSTGSPTVKTVIKNMLHKIGLQVSNSYEDDSGFVLLDSHYCTSIAANSSCAINFTTPNLKVGDSGSTLVNLKYSFNGYAVTTSQTVNYQYVNISALDGVNFTGDLNVQGTPGTIARVVGYLYGAGDVSNRYNVRLKMTNPAVDVANGFVDNQEVVAGQVVPIEFNVPIQNSHNTYATITPAWGNHVVQQQHLQTQYALMDAGTESLGNALTVSISPQQNVSNLVFSQIPLLSTVTGSASATVTVINNGNAAYSGGVTVATSGGVNASDLVVGANTCTGTLESYGANSCTISFSLATTESGNTTVQYKNSGGTVLSSQMVYWLNAYNYPAVSLQPSNSTISFATNTTSSPVTFTITNFGSATLSSMTVSPNSPTGATWSQTASTCGTSLASGASCSVTGTLTASSSYLTGVLTLTARGTSFGTSYTFKSLPVHYTITSAPSVSITPTSGVNLTVLANGVNSVTQTYTVTNNGPTQISVTSYALESYSTVFESEPVIASGGTCTTSTTLTAAQTCTIIVSYGPVASSNTANESGTAHLRVNYNGGYPSAAYSAVSTNFNYTLMGNDSYIQVMSATASVFSGAGTSGSPYTANYTQSGMTITIVYKNMSANYAATGLRLDMAALPPVYTVSSNDCNRTIESGATCTLVLAFNQNAYTLSQGQSATYNFNIPGPSWTTPLGYYAISTSTGESTLYVTYTQPQITMTLSNSTGYFANTVLTMTGAGLIASYPVTLNVAGVESFSLESGAVGSPSSNCTVGTPPSMAVSCILTSTTTSGNVTYTMPTYYTSGESTMIPLKFTSPQNVYLSPYYMFITFSKP